MGLSAPAPVLFSFSIHRSTSNLRLAAICAGSVVVAVLAASARSSSSSRSALARFHLSISDALGGLDTNILLGAGCARGCRDCECDLTSTDAEGSAIARDPAPSSLRAGAGPAAMTCLGGGGGGGASSSSSFGGGGGGGACVTSVTSAPTSAPRPTPASFPLVDLGVTPSVEGLIPSVDARLGAAPAAALAAATRLATSAAASLARSALNASTA